VRKCLAALLLAALFLFSAWLALPLAPLPAGLFAAQPAQVDLVDRNGRPLRTVRPGEEPFRQSAAYAEIPQTLAQATLAAEDARFWRHHGVDWRASLRAAWQWAVNGRVISGGSTITQQLIKLSQPRPRTLRTKFIEAIQALRLEQIWDKQHILAEYLNRLDYGNFNNGCVAAAQFYFAKPLRDLSPAECCLLAGLPQAPSRLNPRTHFERARKRQQWILGRLRLAGWMTEEEFDRARLEPLRLAKPQRAFEAPHFVDLVLQQSRSADVGLQTSGLSSAHAPIKTTLDLGLNHFVEAALRQRLARLQAQHVGNAAAVVLDNRTGDVLALVGSENFFAPGVGQVNGAWAPRSAGSTFKPFTYLLAFERGANPASMVADVPTEFATATGIFAPVNYDRRCYGPMRYRLALANSLNISAVKVLDSLGGPEPLQKELRACGLTTLTRPAEEYGLGLTIGNAEARLLELANAYACLARLGEYRPWRVLLEAPTESRPQRMAEAGAAYLIADILSDNAARTLAFGAESALRFEFPVACKTGTSSDFRDNWAFGFTPEFTAGVWVGNFNGDPMHEVSGVTGAGPMLHEIFEHLHERYGTSWYAKPANIVECVINPITGKRIVNRPSGKRPHPGPLPEGEGEAFDSNRPSDFGFSQPVNEKFIPGFLPPPEDPKDLDAGGRVRLGPEYRDWFASGDNWLSERAVLRQEPSAVRIRFPLPGTTFYLDPDLPQHGSHMVLRAEGADNPQWRSDTLQFTEEAGRQIALLTEGRHRLEVRNPRTNARDQTWIEVLSR
jgi:penicillin-binding protein 1C